MSRLQPLEATLSLTVRFNDGTYIQRDRVYQPGIIAIEDACCFNHFNEGAGEPHVPESLVLFDLVLRPNPNRGVAKDWARVVEKRLALWPELTVIEPESV